MWSLRCLSRRFVDPQRSWSTPFGEIPLDRWYIRYLHNGMVSSTSSSELGKFHHGGWTAKIVIWLLLVVLAFFLPDAVILVYGILLYLLYQLDATLQHLQGEWELVAFCCDFSLLCLCVLYTGLSSEPRDYECNGLNKSRAVSTSTLVLGMLTTVLSVLYSALRAG